MCDAASKRDDPRHDEQAAALEAIAQADEMSVSETIRQAIESRINERRDDAEFQVSG